MASSVDRTPSRPLSGYDVVKDFANLPSGYRGFTVLPGYTPKDLARESVDLSAPLVKFRPAMEEPRIRLNIPVLSAAMQAVSGYRMGIALARMGGLAVIYQSQEPDAEAEQIRTVKRHKGAFIEPEVVAPDKSLSYVAQRMRDTGYSKLFVTENGEQHGRLMGLITNIDFDEKRHGGMLVASRMRPLERLELAYDDEIGENVRAANDRILESHHSALPIIYRDGRLRDVIFRKDIQAHRVYEHELIDGKKRLMVAAAVNTHDYEDRVRKVIDAGADVLVVDTSHGHTEYVKDTCLYIRKEYPGVPLIGGNIVTREGFKFLVQECGVDAVKGGMGIGSICTTADQRGNARGQDRATEECTEERDLFFKETGIYVPYIADGGIRIGVRDMGVALAFGADIVMLGKLLAGTEESTPPVDYTKTPPKKPYWGEGSARARAWREKRGYNLAYDEGVEAWVNYVGPLEPYLGGMLLQLRDGFRTAGCRNIHELHKLARIGTISEEDAAPSALRQEPG
jgi:IMP dehydrogenase